MSPEALTVLLVDDEPLARAFARQQLAGIPDVTVVGECETADALGDALARLDPSIILLDVHMPGRDVFDMLGALTAAGDLPHIIFATAHDAYAVRAFEHNAVDYLMKPYSRERLGNAIDRIRERIGAARRSADAIRSVARDLGPTPTRLLVPERGRLIPIPLESIVWLQAEDDFVRLHTKDRSFMLSRSLSELERKLDPVRFVRVHRSAIVQVARIVEARSEGSGRYSLKLEGGTTVIVSRTHASKLRAWIA